MIKAKIPVRDNTLLMIELGVNFLLITNSYCKHFYVP